MTKFSRFLNEAEDSMKRWNTYLTHMPMLKAGVEVLRKIEGTGKYQALIVGGAVRDIYMGIEPHDIDIATNAPISVLSRLFQSYDIGKMKDFGLVVVKSNGYDFEIAQFRKDGKYSDGRRPDSVKICQDFKSDASRRDFCFNSMGLDKDGNIIDHFNGRKAIKNKVIKTVGNPLDRFAEDGLRLIRAVRFGAKLGFELDSDTEDAIKASTHMLDKVSPERIRDELLKMASQEGDKFANAILMLDRVGILEIILPELVKLKDFPHGPYHPEGPTPWEHVIAALRQNKMKDPIVNLSVLFHDIGKIKTYKKRGHKDTFYGHAEKAAGIIEDIAKRLRLTNKEKEAILFAAVHHMNFHKITSMKPSKVVALMKNKNFDILQATAYCDDACRLHLFNKKDWEDTLAYLEDLHIKEKAREAVSSLINGENIMRWTSIKPGPLVGKIIRAVSEEIINNNVTQEKKVKELVLQTYRRLK